MKLLTAAREGRHCDLGAGDGVAGEIAALELSRVCLGRHAGEIGRRRGVELRNARVTGSWDGLRRADLDFPLRFVDCIFDDELDLRGLHCPHVELLRCRIPRLRGDGLAIAGDLVVAACLAGRVSLSQAVIGGALVLEGTHLEGEEVTSDAGTARREALTAEGVEVGGEVNLRSLLAGASVNLRRSHIAGRLTAIGACLRSGEVAALRLEETRIDRNLDLKFGFHAHGGIDAERLEVGGNLDCRGAYLEVPPARADAHDALDLHDASVVGDLLLKAGIDGRGVYRRFQAHGQVNLFRFTLGGTLEGHGALFVARGRRGGVDKPALDAEEAKIGGSALLDVYASAGDSNRRLVVEAHRSAMPREVRCETVGATSFRRAKVARRLSCAGALLNAGRRHRGLHALMASGLEAGGSVHLRQDLAAGLRFEAWGIVDLDRARIGASLDCGGARLRADERQAVTRRSEPAPRHHLSRALVMRDARVGDSVYLCTAKLPEGAAAPRPSHRFHAIGRVSLVRTEIGGELSCWRGIFQRRLPARALGDLEEGATPRCLNLSDACVRGSLDLRHACFCGQVETDRGWRPVARMAIHARGLEVDGVGWLDHRPEPGGGATDCALFLEGASFGKLLVHPEHSWPDPGHLHVEGLSYGRLELPVDEGGWRARRWRWVRWLARQHERRTPLHRWQRWALRELRGETDPVVVAGAGGAGPPRLRWSLDPHERLAETLRSTGELRAARQVAIDKRRLELRKLPWPAGLAYTLFQWPVGYGYRPWRVLALMFAIYVLGVFVFAAAGARNAMVPADAALLVQSHVELAHGEDVALDHLPAERYPPFEPVVYSADSFLPIINLHQEDYWLAGPAAGPAAASSRGAGLGPALDHLLNGRPADARRLLWTLRFQVYQWLHIICGWLLTTIAVAGLSGLIKTD